MEESILFGADIDDRSLDDAVGEVNESFADATADVQADISGPDGMDLGGGLQAPSGDVSDDVAALVPMADYRNRLLEDILDGIQAGGQGGGEGGGSLLRRIPRLLRNFLGGIGGVGITAAALIGTAATVGAGALIGSVANIGPGDVIGEIPNIKPGNVIGGIPTLGVGDLIDSAVSIGQTGLLGALIANPVTLTASQVLDHLTESGSGETSGQGQADGQGQPSGQSSGAGGVAGTGVTKEQIGIATGTGALGIGTFLGIRKGLEAAGVGSGGGGAAGAFTGLGALPSKTLAGFEKRGITNIIPDDLLGGDGGGAASAGTVGVTSTLGGQQLLNAFLGGGGQGAQGPTIAPGAARGTAGRTQNTRVDSSVDVSVDPSGMDDLKRQIKQELRNDLVDDIASQVERELSIGSGGL